MLTRDKNVIPFASLISTLRLPKSFLAAHCFDSHGGAGTRQFAPQNSHEFMHPARHTGVSTLRASLFSVLGQAQQHESLYAQSLA